jgi:hypothetical protein
VETQAHIRRFDPHTHTHLICSKRAVENTIRIGGQMTFLVHPHLRLYTPFFGPNNCRDIMREFLRYLVQEKNTSLWITTHSSIVRYWEEVLCPEHRSISVITEGNSIKISNRSSGFLESIPVGIRFEGGKKMMVLADIPANSSVDPLSGRSDS